MKIKKVVIILRDDIGAGSEYQFNCIRQEANNIGLNVELLEEEQE